VRSGRWIVKPGHSRHAVDGSDAGDLGFGDPPVGRLLVGRMRGVGWEPVDAA
jgi:hypothetical protein